MRTLMAFFCAYCSCPSSFVAISTAWRSALPSRCRTFDRRLPSFSSSFVIRLFCFTLSPRAASTARSRNGAASPASGTAPGPIVPAPPANAPPLVLTTLTARERRDIAVPARLGARCGRLVRRERVPADTDWMRRCRLCETGEA
jgi:hypothetical protein